MSTIWRDITLEKRQAGLFVGVMRVAQYSRQQTYKTTQRLMNLLSAERGSGVRAVPPMLRGHAALSLCCFRGYDPNRRAHAILGA